MKGYIGPLRRPVFWLVIACIIGGIIALSVIQAQAQSPCTITIMSESSQYHLSLSVPTDWDFVDLRINVPKIGREIGIRVQVVAGHAEFTNSDMDSYYIDSGGEICNQSSWSLQPDGWYKWGPFRVSLPLVLN